MKWMVSLQKYCLNYVTGKILSIISVLYCGIANYSKI